MAKIYRVIRVKPNQLVKENVHTITDLPTKRTYLSAITATNVSRSFYLQDGGKNQLALIWNKITSLSSYVLARAAFTCLTRSRAGFKGGGKLGSCPGASATRGHRKKQQ